MKKFIDYRFWYVLAVLLLVVVLSGSVMASEIQILNIDTLPTPPNNYVSTQTNSTVGLKSIYFEDTNGVVRLKFYKANAYNEEIQVVHISSGIYTGYLGFYRSNPTSPLVYVFSYKLVNDVWQQDGFEQIDSPQPLVVYEQSANINAIKTESNILNYDHTNSTITDTVFFSPVIPRLTLSQTLTQNPTQTQNLLGGILSGIGKILPLILGLIISVISFKKLWSFLKTNLENT